MLSRQKSKQVLTVMPFRSKTKINYASSRSTDSTNPPTYFRTERCKTIKIINQMYAVIFSSFFVNWSVTSRRVITPKNVHLVMMGIDRCNCSVNGLSLNHKLSRTSTQTHCKYISVLIARQSPLSSQKRFLTPYAHICVCIYFFE